MAGRPSSGIQGLVEAGRRAGLDAEELSNFQKMMVQDNASMQHASTVMAGMINKRKPDRVIFRSSKSTPDGDVIYAEEHGRKAWMLRVKR